MATAPPASAAVAPPRSSWRAWLALLPVRIDDRRFWLRAALAVVLREIALQGHWWPLRALLTDAVARTLALLGIGVERLDLTTLAVGASTFSQTVPCTHIEIFALIAPFLWDRSRGAAPNAARLAAVLAALGAAGVLRIALAIALRTHGFAWIWVHDVVLGVFYAVVVALSLRGNAWLRSAAPAGSSES